MRILLIADVHANLPALLALPPAERILCAGDLVSYGPHPSQVIEFLHDVRAVCVSGDEDDAVSVGADHLAPLHLYHACRESRTWTRCMLDRAELALLRGIGPTWEGVLGGVRIALTHGDPGDAARYIEPTSEQLTRTAYAFPDAEVIVLGHTHRPGIWSVGKTLLVNPGSIGQPLRPGYASFAQIEDGTVRLSEIRYDLLETLGDVRRLPVSERARAEIELALLLGGQGPCDRAYRPLSQTGTV